MIIFHDNQRQTSFFNILAFIVLSNVNIDWDSLVSLFRRRLRSRQRTETSQVVNAVIVWRQQRLVLAKKKIELQEFHKHQVLKKPV